ncbi:MAG: hypothetical protein KVP17_003802 [Porospora cf. gigantea B]|uniref:uncharacterized protein n=1 Tax=Porospora cf. gigantea B TaxID=2853592 RepID=UPI003571D8F1|nr:MAG: hypothetical protein KVP17_003802 [Porospora cf. gigantea B]
MSIELSVHRQRSRSLLSLFGSCPLEQILHELPLDLDCGRYIVVLGPTGSGATTLLRALAGKLPGDLSSTIKTSSESRFHTSMCGFVGLESGVNPPFEGLVVKDYLNSTVRIQCPNLAATKRNTLVQNLISNFHLSTKDNLYTHCGELHSRLLLAAESINSHLSLLAVDAGNTALGIEEDLRSMATKLSCPVVLAVPSLSSHVGTFSAFSFC